MSEYTNQEKWERNAFGMTAAQLDREIESQSYTGLELLYGMGILSDCQEILSHSDCDDAEDLRKMLNRVKYIIDEYMEKHNIR